MSVFLIYFNSFFFVCLFSFFEKLDCHRVIYTWKNHHWINIRFKQSFVHRAISGNSQLLCLPCYSAMIFPDCYIRQYLKESDDINKTQRIKSVHKINGEDLLIIVPENAIRKGPSTKSKREYTYLLLVKWEYISHIWMIILHATILIIEKYWH